MQNILFATPKVFSSPVCGPETGAQQDAQQDALRAPQRGAASDREFLDVAVVDSDLGWIAVAYQGDTLHHLTFGHPTADAAFAALKLNGRSDPIVCHGMGGMHGESPSDASPIANLSRSERLAARLQAFAIGEPDDFLDVKLDDQRSTSFQREVVRHCRAIAWGRTLTYQQLAARADSPQAARAVGNVMRTNRFPLVVPCHRVVGANGGLGGYSAPDGLVMKRRLLALEQVDPMR